MKVPTPTATEVENPPGLAAEEGFMNPRDLLVNDLEAATGSVVILTEMRLQYAPAEVRFIPREPGAWTEGGHCWTLKQ